jgi:hypothetical protein
VTQTNWFIIVQANGKWWVDNEGHAFGPFPSREVAALGALDYARKLGDSDRVSQVFWPDVDGKPKLIRELAGETAFDRLTASPTGSGGSPPGDDQV